MTGVASLGATTWYHVAGTYDGTTLRFYVNGVQDASATAAGTITTNALTLRIGQVHSTSACYVFSNGLLFLDRRQLLTRTLKRNG